jgi:hypothetical protein
VLYSLGTTFTARKTPTISPRIGPGSAVDSRLINCIITETFALSSSGERSSGGGRIAQGFDGQVPIR